MHGLDPRHWSIIIEEVVNKVKQVEMCKVEEQIMVCIVKVAIEHFLEELVVD